MSSISLVCPNGCWYECYVICDPPDYDQCRSEEIHPNAVHVTCTKCQVSLIPKDSYWESHLELSHRLESLGFRLKILSRKDAGASEEIDFELTMPGGNVYAATWEYKIRGDSRVDFNVEQVVEELTEQWEDAEKSFEDYLADETESCKRYYMRRKLPIKLPDSDKCEEEHNEFRKHYQEFVIPIPSEIKERIKAITRAYNWGWK